MSDIFSTQKRSEIMRSVRGKNTKPELIVRKFLHSLGFRYRLHDKKLSGTPDIKLTKYNTVIFINGCFWHKHEVCKPFKLPNSNVIFWKDKIERNVIRDVENYNKLKEQGYKIIVIWECELKKRVREKTLSSLVQSLVE
jgi:DNA mismatch endonuclease (patch repair protein)